MRATVAISAAVAIAAVSAIVATAAIVPPAVPALMRTWASPVSGFGNGASSTMLQSHAAPNVVAVASLSSSSAQVNAFNVADGTTAWARTLSGDYSQLPPVQYDQSYIFATTTLLTALAPATGDTLWSVSVGFSRTLRTTYMPVNDGAGAVVVDGDTRELRGIFASGTSANASRSVSATVASCTGISANVVQGSDKYVVAFCQRQNPQFQTEYIVNVYDFTSAATATAGSSGHSNDTHVSLLSAGVQPVWSSSANVILVPSSDAAGIYITQLTVGGSVGDRLSVADADQITALVRLPDRFNSNGRWELFLVIYDNTVAIFDAKAMSWAVKQPCPISTSGNGLSIVGTVDDNGFLFVLVNGNVAMPFDVTNQRWASNGGCNPVGSSGTSVVRSQFVQNSITSPFVAFGSGTSGAQKISVVAFNGNGSTCTRIAEFNALGGAYYGDEGFIGAVAVPPVSELPAMPWDASVRDGHFTGVSGPAQNWAVLTSKASSSFGEASVILVADTASALTGAATVVDVTSVSTAMVPNAQSTQSLPFSNRLGSVEFPGGSQVVEDAQRLRLYYATATHAICLDMYTGAVVWRVLLSEPMTGTPVIAGNHLFLVGRRTVFAVNLDDPSAVNGGVPMRQPYGNGAWEFVPRMQSGQLSPGVSDGAAFYFTAGVDGVYRIDGTSLELTISPSLCYFFQQGDLVWGGASNVGNRHKCRVTTQATPIIDVFTGTMFVYTGDPSEFSNSGTLLWYWPLRDFANAPRWNITVKSTQNSIAPAHGNVFLAEQNYESATRIRSLSDADGSVQWEFFNGVAFTEIVPNQDTLFARGTDGSTQQLYSFRFFDNTYPVRWTRAIDSSYSVMRFSPDGQVILVGANGIEALDYASGRTNWEQKTAKSHKGCTPDGIASDVGIQVHNGMLWAPCSCGGGDSAVGLNLFSVLDGTLVMRLGSTALSALRYKGSTFGYTALGRSDTSVAAMSQTVTQQRFDASSVPESLAMWEPPSAPEKSHTGAIVGGIFGSFAVIGAAAGAFLLLRRFGVVGAGSKDPATVPRGGLDEPLNPESDVTGASTGYNPYREDRDVSTSQRIASNTTAAAADASPDASKTAAPGPADAESPRGDCRAEELGTRADGSSPDEGALDGAATAPEGEGANKV